jgi:hypothetical protein
MAFDGSVGRTFAGTQKRRLVESRRQGSFLVADGRQNQGAVSPLRGFECLVGPRCLSAGNPFQLGRLDEIRAGRRFWGYLDTEPLRTRYALAAHFVRLCPHIVEIGGYRGNVITAFLRGQHESVTVFSLDEEFEPLERTELNGAPCRVRHLREYFQSRPDLTSALERTLGLVVLGLEIHGELQPLLDLIRSARVCILEAALDHSPGIASLEGILSAVHTRTICHIDLDLSANEPMLREELALNMNRPFWRRRMVVLEPVST